MALQSEMPKQFMEGAEDSSIIRYLPDSLMPIICPKAK